MMKIPILTMTLIFLFGACRTQEKDNQQDEINTEEVEIAKNLIQGSFDDLWAGCDSTLISKYHTDDFIILEQGEVWDNDRIKAYMRGQLARPERPKRTNRMEYLWIDKYGASIQIAYYNYATFTVADSLVGEASWLESVLAVPTEDGWRLKMMHSTRVRK